MKKELKQAMRAGINNSNLNGYKWTVTPNGLSWDYGEEFIFTHEVVDEEDGVILITAEAVQSGTKMSTILVGDAFYCDTESLEEAYRMATERTIRNANYWY